ncbi:hypothetical protein HNY73_007266 [Argiope bruennichi]|uniref:Uncharacterized protein n=1 Tax=Argiope bruennichi TaxID=94029 RepID=A0A8T0FFY9_ARGBR|nr:hypothetical protein HNY73_007266 [Argiope bruennichi]
MISFLRKKTHREWEKFSNELQCINNINGEQMYSSIFDVESYRASWVQRLSEAAFGKLLGTANPNNTLAGEVVVVELKFFQNLKNPAERTLGPITAEEIVKVELFIVKETHRIEFSEELRFST